MIQLSGLRGRLGISGGRPAAPAGTARTDPAGYLERGWVIGNHKLVSFNVALISSVLNLPTAHLKEVVVGGADAKVEVLKFMFLSMETVISIIIVYMSWHIAIAIHEMGHFLTAVKLRGLNQDSQERAEKDMAGNKFAWYAKMFLLIPWGRFYGIRKDEGNYAPDAPYNLAVSAAAPVWSQWLATIFLPIAAICIAAGLACEGSGSEILIYVGRFFLAPGCVGLLDRFEADRGKLKQFRQRDSKIDVL